MAHLNEAHVQNAQHFNVKSGGTYNNHYALQG